MDRAQETNLAWSLIEVVKPVLPAQARVWLCAKIGAGDQVEAINELLAVLADRSVELPQPLWAPLADWMSGYLGSDSEPRLRALLARLRMPYTPAPGHRALTAQPHVTHMSRGPTLPKVTPDVNALIEVTAQEGIPQDVAAECCWSLVDLTINDAFEAARKAIDAGSVPHPAGRRVKPSKTTTDAIKWMRRGVRTEARSTAAERNGS